MLLHETGEKLMLGARNNYEMEICPEQFTNTELTFNPECAV